jgi:hypothetical protein
MERAMRVASCKRVLLGGRLKFTHDASAWLPGVTLIFRLTLYGGSGKSLYQRRFHPRRDNIVQRVDDKADLVYHP